MRVFGTLQALMRQHISSLNSRNLYMRSMIFVAALLATTTSPLLAQQNCEAHRNSRVIGTVAGAGIGGVLGNVIAGSGDKTLGTIIGAVGGGVVGNQISRGSDKDRGNCANAYGYYDKSGTWHASNVPANAQTGYYDRDSNWIEGAPRGYYDSQNRWVSAQGNSGQIGYRDANGRWVAPRADNFDANNRYNSGTATGHWQNGRWIADDTGGNYDRDGRWQPGQVQGRRDADGNWIADEQPGYYDQNGRWVPGTVHGRYDAQGRFIAENGNGYGNAGNRGGQRDIESRFERIAGRIERGVNDGDLSRNDARRANTELESIRRYDRSLRNRNGAISASDAARVQTRLNRLSDRLRAVRENG
jgi:hypothetical protein